MRVVVPVCGFCIYCNIWDATIGQEPLCECEPNNNWDRYTVEVIKDEIVVGQIQGDIALLKITKK